MGGALAVLYGICTCMGSPVSRLSSIFGNSAIVEVMYVTIFRASLAEPASSA